MIRITKVGELTIRDMEMHNWWMEGEGETMTGDVNDPTTQAGKIMIAAVLIHQAGYAGFSLIKRAEDGTELDAARAALIAIDAARQ